MTEAERESLYCLFESGGSLAGQCLFHDILTVVLLIEFVCLRLNKSHCESRISKLCNKLVCLKSGRFLPS